MTQFFPNQVYLWGVLTPLKGLHARTVWFYNCLRGVRSCRTVVALQFHLSPPSTLWVLWATWFYTCLSLVSPPWVILHLSSTCLGLLCYTYYILLHLFTVCAYSCGHWSMFKMRGWKVGLCKAELKLLPFCFMNLRNRESKWSLLHNIANMV